MTKTKETTAPSTSTKEYWSYHILIDDWALPFTCHEIAFDLDKCKEFAKGLSNNGHDVRIIRETKVTTTTTELVCDFKKD